MEKLWNWAIASFTLVGKTDEEIISLCRYAGISAVEADISFVIGKTDAEIEEVREKYEKASLALESFHLPFGQAHDISSFYETLRKQAVKNMEECLEKASMLGSRTVILHPAANPCTVEEEGLERYITQLGKSLDVLIPKAEKSGVVIAIENMLPGEKGNRFGSSPDHFRLFVSKFAHPHLGFCLDTGHALVSGGPGGPAVFFETMSQHLVAFHLQDNAGDRDSHLAPGHGLVDWNTIFRSMFKIQYAYSACIEAPPFSYGPNYTHSIDSWKKLIEETDSLVRKSIAEN